MSKTLFCESRYDFRMDLRRLRMLVAVVDHGGFTAAAKAEHVAQPGVSLAVRELEAEMGAELLVRSRDGVRPTAAGEALLPLARQALRDVESAAEAVAAVTGVVAGRLDVASLPTLAADPVAGMVGHFRRAHPGVTVRLSSPESPVELADHVRAGEAELGITERVPANHGLEEVALADQRLLAVSPPGTPGGKGPLALRRLAGQPLVVSPPGSSLRSALEEALDDLEVEPAIAVVSEQRDALVSLVLAGAGTAFVPPALATAAGALGAVVRPTTPVLRRHLVAVHRPGTPSPAATRFLAAA
jgi:LysR family transcriptional regulator, carnitine catabolism transcriptional activator